jgi:REP element-mobilizing transposase RayT
MGKASRPRRPEYLSGHYYHIYNRGASHTSIFLDADNFLFVIRKMKKYSRELNLTLIAYCLMPNHYHFLIRQNAEQAASLLPQRVFNSYSKAYNKRFDHTGTLFEGPYQVIHIEEESHLLHLCRYIHANPAKDDLVSQLEEWSYSNYPEWMELRLGTLVDRDFVRSHFPTPELYKAFVWAYLKEIQI